MKKRSTFITGMISFFLISLTLYSCSQKPVDATSDITRANKGFTEAFNNGDANAIAENYTSDAKLYPPNSNAIEGREAIKDFWSSVLNMGIKKAVLETVTAQSIGATAIEEGKYKLYVEGDQMVDQGKYMVIWKKDSGKWKLHRDMWNTSNPAPTPRASLNDTVWVVWNPVKADKVSQFEDFNFNYLEPAALEYYPKMRNTVRFLKPVEPNKDGTYTYFYLMDPATSPDGYDMKTPLTAKYGEEKAKEYLKMCSDCLKDGKQEWVVAVQTKW